MPEEKTKITIDLELDQDEMRELKEITDKIESDRNPEKDEESFEKFGLHRKRYQITCEAKDANGNEVSWVEKAYGRTLALAVGAVACQAKVGNPNCSARKL